MPIADPAVLSLRPTQKDNIIEVVAQAGIDVSDWSTSTKGNPNTNPKYCYEWAFGDGSSTLLCLWFAHMQSDEQGIYQSNTLWPDIKRYEAIRNTSSANRAARLDSEIQRAYFEGKSVRVAVVDGRMRADELDKPSSVEYRQLDSEPWFVTSFDGRDGTYMIRRGTQAPAGPTMATEDRDPEALKDVAPPILEDSDSDIADDLAKLRNRSDLAPTTRRALFDARLGQGGFRKAVLGAWGGACAATGCALPALLRASHIQPWRDANDEERLDPENGLPLTANLDALFDRGLISFADDGILMVSGALPVALREELNLPTKLRREPSSRQRLYLSRHRRQYFPGD